MKGTVILSHGLESGPDATKVTALARVCAAQGWAEVRPDYRDLDARRDPRGIMDRVARALAGAPQAGRVVFAGSSLGAFTSGLASLAHKCDGLFLLALPVRIDGVPRTFAAAEAPTAMVHGWRDELCPVDAAIAFASARNATLHVVDDGHRLAGHVEACAAWFGEFLAGLG